MIFYQTDSGETNGGDLNATVIDVDPSQAPAEGGLPEALPEDAQEMQKSQQQYQDWLKKYNEMLGYFHGGNTAQRASGGLGEFPNFQTIAGVREQAAAGKITGRDYLLGTGRINAGIGTGDKAIRGDRGDIVGYKSPSGAALQGGSLVGGEAQLTDPAKWDVTLSLIHI